MNVGKSFEKFTQQRSYEGERRCLICLCGRRLACVIANASPWLFKEVSQRCLITPLPISRGLVCIYFGDFVFFPEEVFFRTLETQMLVIMPLVCFLSGKPSILKASSTPVTLTSSFQWIDEQRPDCQHVENVTLGLVREYVSMCHSGVLIFAAIIFLE